jgi:hypothetical protein
MTQIKGAAHQARCYKSCYKGKGAFTVVFLHSPGLMRSRFPPVMLGATSKIVQILKTYLDTFIWLELSNTFSDQREHNFHTFSCIIGRCV